METCHICPSNQADRVHDQSPDYFRGERAVSKQEWVGRYFSTVKMWVPRLLPDEPGPLLSNAGESLLVQLAQTLTSAGGGTKCSGSSCVVLQGSWWFSNGRF